MERLRILLVGDYDINVTAHRANPLALQLAAEQAGCDVQGEWPGTEAIARDPSVLRDFDAVWCVPASPYANMEGALRAIRMARETGTPFLGTCGGFQHAIIEYARNVLGHADADHEESNPDSSTPLISRLSCSLVEVQGEIRIEPGSLAESWIGQSSVVEEYHCNFGLQADQEIRFRDADLCFTGRDAASGEVRIAELRSHPFFVITLFQPERAALRGRAHPLITALLRATLRPAERNTRGAIRTSTVGRQAS